MVLLLLFLHGKVDQSPNGSFQQSNNGESQATIEMLKLSYFILIVVVDLAAEQKDLIKTWKISVFIIRHPLCFKMHRRVTYTCPTFPLFLRGRTQMQPCFQPSAIPPLQWTTTPSTVRHWTRLFVNCVVNMASNVSCVTDTARPTKTMIVDITNQQKWRWVPLWWFFFLFSFFLALPCLPCLANVQEKLKFWRLLKNIFEVI